MAEEQALQPRKKEDNNDARAEWSPRPFLRGVLLGLFFGLYVTVLVFYLLPVSVRELPPFGPAPRTAAF